MKKLFSISVFFTVISLLYACGDRTANDGKSTIVRDSLINILPNYSAVHINLGEDRSEMTVVVADVKFYSATAEEKNKKAEELGKMILRIYGKDNYLQKGNLILTKDINNTSDTPADGIKTPIDFEGLKKVVFPN